MGKYTINYACGHGEYEKQLFGKTDSRDSYVEWAEKTIICPDCYKIKMREADKDTPLKAEIIVSMFGWIGGGATIAVTAGDTYSIKDALKAASFRWEDYTPASDFLGAGKPRKAWMVRLLMREEIGKITTEELTKRIEHIQSKLTPLGIAKIEMDNSPLARITYAVAAKEVHHADCQE